MYNKPKLTIAEQIALLKSRGLQILPADKAEHILGNVSYYQLAEYWQPNESPDSNKRFKPGSTFSDAIGLYNFDRKLRAVMFDILGRIETSLRSKMIYHLSLEHGPWWFEEADLFFDKDDHDHALYIIRGTVKRASSTLIKQHLEKYQQEEHLPPAWKTLELVSLTTLARIYENLDNGKNKSKNVIAQEWGLESHDSVTGWLKSISQIRNICAHYERLWNRRLRAAIPIPKQLPDPWIKNLPADKSKLYLHLCCVKYVLNRVHPENSFTRSLQNLFLEYPRLDISLMGFVKGWEKEALWQGV